MAAITLMAGRIPRVLLVEHNVDGTVGGSHVCLLEICRHLDRSKFSPVVWFFEHNALVERFQAEGVEVIIERPPGPVAIGRSMVGVLRRIAAPVQSMVNLARVLVTNRKWWQDRLLKYRVDLVHLNNSALDDVDLQLACRRMKIPCVAHQRGISPPSKWLSVQIAKRLGAIIAISTAVRDDLASRGLAGARIKLIFDGIDAARIRAIPPAGDESLRELGIPPEARLIGIVGNVKRWKGQAILMRAMGSLHQTQADIHCLFVGAVVDRRYFSELCSERAALGLDGVVHFTDFHPNPAALMARMEIVVHASIEPEPFGIVLLEAMALSKPVIASAAGGPLDIIEDRISGLLYPIADSAALADSLSALLRNPEARRRIGQAGSRRLEQCFTARRNGAQVAAIYASLLGHASSW